MSMMWRGPSAELQASYSDPLASAITRRCAKLGVFFNTGFDGRSAEVFELVRQHGDYAKRPLGTVNGLDPIDTMLRVAYDHTPFDDAFIAQRVEYLIRKAERLVLLVRDEIKLCDEIDALIDAMRLPCPLIVEGRHLDSGLPGGACEVCMNTGRVPRV